MSTIPTVAQGEKDTFQIVAVLRQAIARLSTLVGTDNTSVIAQKIALTDGITAPSTLSGTAYIYVDTSDGDLKVKFGDGTVKTIVTDT